ncbi:MAG TPA: serine--tRNA ligase, partial [Chitinophagaceae bacterium]|nr:serine--tRNA ligase [Chitinophagaceae bacterium]
MLQLAFIRNNKEEVKQRLTVKNFAELNIVDDILSFDEERKRLQQDFDSTQAKVNSTSKEIGQLMAKGQKDDAENKKQEVTSLKSSLQPISDRLSIVERQLQDALVKLP